MIVKTDYPQFGESIFQKTLASGLRVVIIPKPGFVRKAATLVVPFGSLSHRVSLERGAKQIVFPIGTAHFLEHMLFETTSDNTSRKFALLGASVNAYTTYNRTAVYFSTTNGLGETLDVMFDMIDRARFSKSGIEKERDIILKEIQLYQDDPEQQLYYDMLGLMYPRHPIRFDIAGTEASLAMIGSDTLKEAYDAFYHPRAMVLVLSGDFEYDKTLSSIEKHSFNKTSRPYLEPEILIDDDPELTENELIRKFDLMADLVMVGVKMTPDRGANETKTALEEIMFNLLLDNLYGKSSPAFKKMQAAKVVNNAFDISVACDLGFAYATLFTETKNSQKTINALKALIRDTGALIDPEQFEIQKRKLLGGFVQVFDSVSRANAMLAEYYLRGIDIFKLIEEIDRVKATDLEALKQRFHQGAITTVNYVRYR